MRLSSQNDGQKLDPDFISNLKIIALGREWLGPYLFIHIVVKSIF